MKLNTRYLAVTGMLSAIGFILMYIEISVSIMPFFIKLDFSELPALIGAFAFGPGCGVLVCLIKNLLHMLVSTTACVGELANFLMGAVFAGTAGMIYKKKKTKKRAVVSAFAGAILMGLMSLPINYFIAYPLYDKFVLSYEAILGACEAIIPSVDSIFESLICFNVPFTTAKGLISVVITLLVYKHLSPLLKGNR